MAKTKVQVFVTAVLYSVMLCFVLAVIAFAMYYTDNFSSDGKKFYVQYGSQEIIQNTNEIALPTDKHLIFYCKYPLGDKKDFTVSIVPDSKRAFDFTVDGLTYVYNGETDITSGFNIQKYDGYFSLFLPKYLAMTEVLQKVYEGKTISDIPQIDLTEKDYFKLIVSSYNAETVIQIGFHLLGGAE